MKNILFDTEALEPVISKFFKYKLAIISGFMLETYVVNQIPFLHIAAGCIVITELKSIIENLSTRKNPINILEKWIKKIGALLQSI